MPAPVPVPVPAPVPVPVLDFVAAPVVLAVGKCGDVGDKDDGNVGEDKVEDWLSVWTLISFVGMGLLATGRDGELLVDARVEDAVDVVVGGIGNAMDASMDASMEASMDAICVSELSRGSVISDVYLCCQTVKEEE